MNAPVLIIGGDAAGMSAASQYRRRKPDHPLLVIERGQYTSYSSCGIPYYIGGVVPDFDDLIVFTPNEFEFKRGIDVRVDWEAKHIDTQRNIVTAIAPDRSEKELPYEQLLIATGASPIMPAWPGADLEGIVRIRNLEQTIRLQAQLNDSVKNIVIVGGGYVGLEMAEAFQLRGFHVTVVEKDDVVLGADNKALTEAVENICGTSGVNLRLNTTVQGFEGDSRVRKVITDQGELEADLVLVALGVKPNSQIAADAGIELGAQGAIAVNRQLETNISGIFAAGDCAEAYHRILKTNAYVPLALTANRQGRIAGENLAGGQRQAPGVVGTNVTKVFDLVVGRTGLQARELQTHNYNYTTTHLRSNSRSSYYPGNKNLDLYLHHDANTGTILGALMFAEDHSVAKRIDLFAIAISAGMTISEYGDLDLAYAPPFSPTWDPTLQIANKAAWQQNES